MQLLAFKIFLSEDAIFQNILHEQRIIMDVV